MEPNAIGLRGVLTKEGSRDTRLELRHDPFGYAVVIDGKEVGRYYRTYSAQQLMTGNCPPMTLGEAWLSYTAKHFPSYVATNMEEHR